jgi:hypothetical protein
MAYLDKRWATYFAGELFRTSAVFFMGYSINDPVLRYRCSHCLIWLRAN